MLYVEKLHYAINGRSLIKELSFQVRQGEVLAILGANGAGKSTLMNLICGHKKPHAGQIRLHYKSLDSYAVGDLARMRAMLCQQNTMSMGFKVQELVLMGRYPHFKSVATAYDFQIVEEVMTVCAVSDFRDRIYLSLSGGEQQRVQLARVLAQLWDNPNSLLLLDEPVSALDLKYQHQVMSIAKALSRRGFMVLVVLHDLNLAAIYADRILLLKNGRKWFDGTPAEVLNKQSIYSIFSVEADITMHPSTLKPMVQVAEMEIEPLNFNSVLPPSTDKYSQRDLSHKA